MRVVVMTVGLLLVALRAGRVLAAQPSAPAQIRTQIRAVVAASGATVKTLTVDLRSKRLRLVVVAHDPARYLKHRYERVVEAIFPRLERRVFRFTFLVIIDPRSRRQVFRFSDVPDTRSGIVTSWRIDPRLLDSARAVLLPDYEVDPDQSAPPCPAH
jgi:hypothetical protein